MLRLFNLSTFFTCLCAASLLSALFLYKAPLAAVAKRWGNVFKIGKMSAESALAVHHQTDYADRCVADLLPRVGNRLLVLSGAQLLSLRDVNPWVVAIEKQSGLLSGSFQRDCEPVLIAVAQYVQLLPASQSHHHANPGGLLVHLLESAAFAVSIRKSRTLPVNAPVESIAKRQHRWTYAVFLASLLHDIGKPLADLNVQMLVGGDSKPWNPMTAAMNQLGATQYEVNFASQRNYYLHEKLPILFLKSLVPEASIQWLAEDDDCFNELTQFLSRDRRKAAEIETTEAKQSGGAIAEIITLADQKSVAQNLLSGSRSRFNVAAEPPLIEKLVTGLREMLQQQMLPLNRAGAAGWVFEGDLWIAGKRLADELRVYLTSKDIKGIPGADKNDRVFDTFQEYGFLVKNPLNNRSIWHVNVMQDDGWSYDLTVLRFSLNKVYLDLSTQPLAMAGKITVLAGKNIEMDAACAAPIHQKRVVATASALLPIVANADADAVDEPTSPEVGTDFVNATDTTDLISMVMASSLGVSLPTPSMPKTVLPSDSMPDVLKLGDGFLAIKTPKTSTNNAVPSAVITASITASVTAMKPPLELRSVGVEVGQSPSVVEAQHEPVTDAPLYLPESESASHDKKTEFKPLGKIDIPPTALTSAKRPALTATRPEKVGRTLSIAGKSIELLAPVTPNVSKQMAKLTGPSDPPEAAVAFMRWLQEGIVGGEIQINQSVAQVHFVKLTHPAIAKGVAQSLMLLVTPLCFRDFAESNTQYGDSKTVQSAFLKAKWHVTAETGNINILRFKTPGNNNGVTKLLSCIGVQYPENFVNPVPSANELLVYDDATTRQFLTYQKK
jgi:integrating conjugative element relaxase (TIGR03760 family)